MAETGSDYLPIACVAHERLEFAVLRRQGLALEIDDGAGARRHLVALPLDVLTRDGAEWLICRTEDGAEVRLRLDRILDFAPVERAISK
jgi:Rho-binding antiterminator